jgi:hypothetical protein
LDLRSLLICSAVLLAGSVGIAAIPLIELQGRAALHSLLFFGFSAGGGALYAFFAARRHKRMAIHYLSLGGALVGFLPAAVFEAARYPISYMEIDGRQMLDPLLYIAIAISGVVGAVLGCVAAVVTAMYCEARVIRRNRRHEDARPMPDPSRKHR